MDRGRRVASLYPDHLSTMIDALSKIYRYCAHSEEQRALEYIIITLESSLSDGLFEDVDAFLVELDVTRISPTVLIGILTMTYHGKAHLLKRDEFLQHAEAQLKTALGEERAERLLKWRR